MDKRSDCHRGTGFRSDCFSHTQRTGNGIDPKNSGSKDGAATTTKNNPAYAGSISAFYTKRKRLKRLLRRKSQTPT